MEDQDKVQDVVASKVKVEVGDAEQQKVQAGVESEQVVVKADPEDFQQEVAREDEGEDEVASRGIMIRSDLLNSSRKEEGSKGRSGIVDGGSEVAVGGGGGEAGAGGGGHMFGER